MPRLTPHHIGSGTMAEKTNGSATAAKADEGMSKKEGVRRALRILGNTAGPLQLQDFLKKEFHITMTTDHISNYKSDILRKEGGGHGKKTGAKKHAAKKHATSKLVKPAPKPMAASHVAKAVTRPASHAHPGGRSSNISLDD